MPLKNPKHEIFAQEVAKGTPIEQAYAKAGYTPCPKNAARLTKKDEIRTRIDELLSRAAEKAEATIAKTLEEIARLAFADVGQAVSWSDEGIKLKNSEDLPPHIRAAISEVKQTRDGVSIKFHSKTAALEMLAKHFGLFKEKLELTGKDGGAITVESMSEVEIARRLAFILARGARHITP